MRKVTCILTAIFLSFFILTASATQGFASGKGDIVDTAVSAGSFETLVAAIKAAGLVETLKGEGPFTVLAPTDEAFAKLPDGTLASLLLPENKAKLQAILTYHVISGKVMAKDVMQLDAAKTVFGQEIDIKAKDNQVMANDANIVKTDIETSNGIIHVIDTVLLPKNLVEVAVSAGNFKTLVTAVKAAGLAETLKGDGPFTVFAPTDEAFAKLPEGTLGKLLLPENKEKLKSILLYHVVPGNVMAADVANLKAAKTVNGQEVRITIKDDKVMINDAKVLQPDIKALNGVIHVIDSVIMPKSKYSSTY